MMHEIQITMSRHQSNMYMKLLERCFTDIHIMYIVDNLQIHDFVVMTTEQRTELKVRLLLERYKVVIKSQVWFL